MAFRVWSSNRIRLLLTRRGETGAQMARRTFEMVDLIEIYVHWYAGRSQVQIAQSLGVDRKTVRKYLAPVAAAGLRPGGPPVMAETDWRARAQSWFPALVDTGLRQVTWPAIEVHRDYISAQLAAGVTVATIHQRLVEEHGWSRRWPRCGGGCRGTCPRRPAAPGCGCCARGRSSPAVRRRSTTGAWGCGPTRAPAAGTRCRRSSWSWRAPGTCSCARSCGWTRRRGPVATSRRSRSSAGSQPVWSRTI